jgi:hypothetical protein
MFDIVNTSMCLRPRRIPRPGLPGACFVHGGLTMSSSALPFSLDYCPNMSLSSSMEASTMCHCPHRAASCAHGILCGFLNFSNPDSSIDYRLACASSLPSTLVITSMMHLYDYGGCKLVVLQSLASSLVSPKIVHCNSLMNDFPILLFFVYYLQIYFILYTNVCCHSCTH